MRTTSLLKVGPVMDGSGGRTTRCRAATNAQTRAAARMTRRTVATLLRLDGRGELDAPRQARGDEARRQRRGEGHRERGHDQPQRCVVLDGSAERLFVDQFDESPR